ncbi:MAG: hypothetical protein K0Q79_535 [Flavipsychrobacter sp.]|jgi:uncharacterized damage-inducible protein DinB|nr:hypothetical protein [Flavipsychrobacter sp.]
MTNKEFFIKSWKNWATSLSKAILALPNDPQKLAFTHHPSFRSPWELVNHIAPHAIEVAQGATAGKVDLVNEGKFDINGPNTYKSTAEAAKAVEDNTAKLISVLEKLDDNTWATQMTPIFWGPMQIMEMPLCEIGWMMHNDMIYHTGQLTSYYRVIGAEQPSVAGPTYEQEVAMMAQANAN